MSKSGSPSSNAKKLRQAQLPFLVLHKCSPSATKKTKKVFQDENSGSIDPENKENQPKQRKHTKNDAPSSEKSDPPKCEPMVVDLTEDDSRHAADVEIDKNTTKMPLETIQNIENAIDAVVKRCSSEFATQPDGNLIQKENTSVKKRRRRSRSLSPLPPNAKRAVLCENEENQAVMPRRETDSVQESTQSGQPPDIVVTAPTPIRNQGDRSGFKKLLENFSKQTPGEDESSEAKIGSCASTKEKTKKYAPLSSVLGKKRPRSKSPTGRRHQTSEKEEKATDKAEKKVKQADPSSDTENDDKVPDSTVNEPVLDKNQCMITAFLKRPKQDPEKNIKTEIIQMKKIHDPIVNEDATVSLVKDEKEQNQVTCASPPAKSICFAKEVTTPPPTQKSESDANVSPPKSGEKKRRSLESQKKKEEKEREKEEKRKQREEQRLAKEKEKLELKRKKEEERLQKEEERKKKREEEEAAKVEKQRKLEEKRLEKEKLELEKKLEREKKEEERRKEKERREEEKKQKDLERQKIEREKQQAEEEKKRKDEKRAESFKSFFKSPARSPSVKKTTENTGLFHPFQLKKDMMLAPLRRAKITSAQRKDFEESMEKQDITSEYLQEVARKPKFVYGPTMPRFRRKLVSLAEDGLELIDDDSDSKPGVKILRAKFLSFHKNYRPPYYGTWRKESKTLSYKNPFKKDSDIFDYEFDSDDEWEEPAEGEDIANSDGEDEGEGNEEDEDDGFFVPHGYLSDDEGINEDGEEDGLKPDHKLKQKQLEFEASFKRKLSTLTPIVIGCVWKDSAESLDKVHKDILNNYKPEFMTATPIEIFSRSSSPANVTVSPDDAPKSDQAKKSRLKAVPDEAIPDLIRLLHGNALAVHRVVNEFRTYWKIKKSSAEPLTVGPAPLEDVAQGMEAEPMVTDSSPMEVISAKSGDMVGDSTSLAQEEATKTVVSTPKSDDCVHEISKTQLTKKCKEIATYSKRDHINRCCWFVHDSVLERYELDKGKAPIPCKWNYATEVPKIQILIFPQALPQTPVPVVPTPIAPKQSPGLCIAKFVAKISPNTILEQSKQKHDKEKQAAVIAASIAKYTTEKISPTVIIETSAQKIAEDQLKAKQVQEQEALKAAQDAPLPAQQQEGTYSIPTPQAVRSFFKIDEKGVVDLTSQDSNA